MQTLAKSYEKTKNFPKDPLRADFPKDPLRADFPKDPLWADFQKC